MKKRSYAANLLLALTVGAVCLAAVLIRTFAPAVVLPAPSIPWLAALSLTALAAESYQKSAERRCGGAYLTGAALAAITFFLVPAASGLYLPDALFRIGLLGGLTFLLADVLFSSICTRLESGNGSRAAPAISAFLLYLAAQGLMGPL